MDLNTRTELNLIHLGALKLVKSLPHSWNHSSQQIWRLRCSFVMVVCILVGVGLVMISNAEKKYAAHHSSLNPVKRVSNVCLRTSR
jgi:cell division protein FtsW (lipid II flippase)